MSLSFELLGTDGMARRGRIGTAHGTVVSNVANIIAWPSPTARPPTA